MGKDTEKYRYLNIGLGWDSWVLAQLVADAEMHQMGDQPGKLAALRLTEYYRLVDRGIIVPGVTVLSKLEEAQKETTSDREEALLAKKRSRSPTRSEETTVLSESTNVGANANAALLAFLSEEEL